MKTISYHRAVRFLHTQKTVQSYAKVTGKSFRVNDSIDGTTSWCDFLGEEEWGECTNAYQGEMEAGFLHKTHYNLNIEAFEKEYLVEIKKSSIPNEKLKEYRCYYPVNSKQIVKDGLVKKLEMRYRYRENGFSEKGTLILGIFDPVFGGFTNDLELNKPFLEKLRIELLPQFLKSSFRKIVLVDVLTLFQSDLKNLMYELL